MRNQVEIKIQKWLKEGESHKQISKKLMRGLLKNEFDQPFNQEEKKSSVFFTINAGFQKELYGQFSAWLKNKIFFPWACFIKILSENKIILEGRVLDDLFTGADKDNALEMVSISRNWDKQDPRFHYLRKQIIKDRQADLDNRRLEFNERLEYFKLQRMLDEEKKVLNQFVRIFPKDGEIENKFRDYDLRWASYILNQSKIDSVFDKDCDLIRLKRNAPMQAEVTFLQTCAKEYLQKYRNKIQDMAMIFVFIDEPQAALNIYSESDLSNGKDWLNLELLFLSGRFFECLEALDLMENSRCDDPEAPFACSYLKAKVLWGIGQSDMAIQLMKNLSRVRPKYRSASALLAQWSSW